MKPWNIIKFSVLDDLRIAIAQAFRPTLLALVRSPMLLLRPRELSKLIFANVWVLYGDGVDAHGHQTKDDLISQNAYGIVLDIGAGHGHTALYLSKSRVTKYVALEPNVLMHSQIRAKALQAGFSEDAGTFLILSCGAEDIPAIISQLGTEHQVDTLISVLTLCSVPQPEQTIQHLVKYVLKPGGQLLFYEHVASRRSDVLFWQKFWSPLWRLFFDGCVLDRPTDRYIQRLGDIWEAYPEKYATGNRVGIWEKEGEEDDHLFLHRAGRLIKRQV